MRRDRSRRWRREGEFEVEVKGWELENEEKGWVTRGRRRRYRSGRWRRNNERAGGGGAGIRLAGGG